ncbi:MAG: sugar-binding domain-containing protein [Verrucomicrobiales bacterium]
MRCFLSLLFLALTPIIPTIAQEESAKVDDNAKTPREGLDSPDTAYPRPMMMRPEWTSLDGRWDFAITGSDQEPPTEWQGKINVPAALESEQSGVERPLPAGQHLWYRRKFPTPEVGAGEIVALQFGAVSTIATVWLNGNPVAAHRGGHAPFSADITGFLSDAPEQELTMSVTHPDADVVQRPASTGITQAVWLEVLPQTYIKELRLSPDVKLGEITVFASIWGQAQFRPLEIVALDGEKETVRASAYYHYKKGGYEATLKIPEPQFWSPESPKLYGLRIRLANEDGTTHDDVTSYFALREASLLKSDAGTPRLALNGEPLLLLGLEGEPDTIPHDDRQIRAYLEKTRAMGFNCVRLRDGLANPRFYHWADRIGMLVWQGLPSPAVVPFPFLSDPAALPAPPEDFLEELGAIRARFQKHPSIVLWPGALPNDAEDTDRPLSAGRAGICQGADLQFINGHPGVAMPSPDGAGNSALGVAEVVNLPAGTTRSQLESRTDDLQRLIRAGLSAIIFQDSPAPTLDPAWLAGTHAKLVAGTSIAEQRIILPSGGTWSYTDSAPPAGWHLPAFDDAGWDKGNAPFGAPKLKAKTPWTGDRLWLRQNFELESPQIEDLLLKIINNDQARIYLNGQPVADCSGGSSAFRLEPLSEDAAALLVDGDNTIAIEIKNASNTQSNTHYLDAGLTALRP